MSFQALVAHYAQLLQDGIAGVSDGLSWTVVRPVTGHLSLDETAARMTGGGHPSIVELDVDEAMDREAVRLHHSGSTTMLVQTQNYPYASAPQVLQWLSVNAQVWHLEWTISGSVHLSYAAHGQVLAHLAEGSSASGSDPGSLYAEWVALDRTIGVPWPAKKATAMAIVESRTGAHLDADWFERPQPAVVIDTPISSDLPPIGFWHHEPDLDARIRLAPEHARRAVLLRVVYEMALRFQHDAVPGVSEALQGAWEGRPVDGAALDAIDAVHEDLGQHWAGMSHAEREQDSWRWTGWVAANAIRHCLRSLDGDARRLDGLTYARAALSESWPDFKERLRELATIALV
ncbi:hypothetical protein [Streptosporangium sp. KLBMP 9127]|nr:hypothetical protein [Streptosporangium sp. KLBMP 9127]